MTRQATLQELTAATRKAERQRHEAVRQHIRDVWSLIPWELRRREIHRICGYFPKDEEQSWKLLAEAGPPHWGPGDTQPRRKPPL